MKSSSYCVFQRTPANISGYKDGLSFPLFRHNHPSSSPVALIPYLTDIRDSPPMPSEVASSYRSSHDDLLKRHRRSTSPLSPSTPSAEQANVVNHHMINASNPRKRQRPSSQAPQPFPKKQKLTSASASFQYPPEFWDNLSKIWLTRSALKELDCRNARSIVESPSPSCRRITLPVTSRAVAESKKTCWPVQPVSEFLQSCGTTCLENIRVFSRHGGPDLSDLRGVCVVLNTYGYRS